MSSGCKEFCLHKMSVRNERVQKPLSDGRVVELNVPTLADWMQQLPDGLLGTHVSLATPAETARCADMEDNGQGAIVPRSTAQGDDAEGFGMGMAIDGASHHDSQGAVWARTLREWSQRGGRGLDEPASRLVDEGCWSGTTQKLHADR